MWPDMESGGKPNKVIVSCTDLHNHYLVHHKQIRLHEARLSLSSAYLQDGRAPSTELVILTDAFDATGNVIVNTRNSSAIIIIDTIQHRDRRW